MTNVSISKYEPDCMREFLYEPKQIYEWQIHRVCVNKSGSLRIVDLSWVNIWALMPSLALKGRSCPRRDGTRTLPNARPNVCSFCSLQNSLTVKEFARNPESCMHVLLHHLPQFRQRPKYYNKISMKIFLADIHIPRSS